MNKNVQYTSNRIQKNLREKGYLNTNTIYIFKTISPQELEEVLDVLYFENEDLEIKKNLHIVKRNLHYLHDRKNLLMIVWMILNKKLKINLNKFL